MSPNSRIPVTSNTASLDLVRAALGPAAYDRHGVLLYEGDCLELLAKLPESLVDLTVTSPPYNIGKAYEARRPLDEYVEWCASWLSQIYRVTASNGALWLNLGYTPVPDRARAMPISYLLWEHIPFFLVQEVVWHYGAGVAARRSYSPRNEKFLWYIKDPDDYYFDLDAVRDPNVKYPNQFKNGKRKVNLAGKNPTDVWAFPKVTSGMNRSSRERTPHPAQFPVAVIERILRGTSGSGALVMDPFMGSGTTAEVALRNGRHVVGFELNPDYLDIAIRRIERAATDPAGLLMQLPLREREEDRELA
jgi:adenine-specific DNA-methyltransferase